MKLMVIVLIILLSLVAFLIYYYNKFIRLRNQVDESWSGVDVQLKRRYDLIPNLVETVKGYAKHEKGTFESVVKARNEALKAQTPAEKSKAEAALTVALRGLFALAEAYPELKANINFLELQKQLSEIEDNIQLARRYYNAVVRDYNILCESFPSLIVANLFGFTKRDFFEIPEEERENVKVSF
jgi:LemA protein